MSSPACLDDCGSVHGFCNQTLLQCECEFPWVNLGDFVPSPNLICDINFEVSKGLWTACAVLHAPLLVLLFMSLISVRRGTKRRTRIEFISVLNLLFGVSCSIGVSVLEATASQPGQRTVGIDLLTTVIYCLGEICVTLHAVYLPFVPSGTSIVPFAVMSHPFLSKHLRELRTMYGILFIMILVLPCLWFGVVFSPQNVLGYMQAGFACTFIVAFSSALMTYIATKNLVSKIDAIKTSTTKPVSGSQLDGLDITRKRASGTKNVSLAVIFLLCPQYLAFTIYPLALLRAGWVWLPLHKISHGCFDYRFPYLSLTTSRSHHKTESQQRTRSNSFDVSQQQRIASSELLLGIGKLPGKKQKRKILTRVDEERTVDIRTQDDGTSD